MTRRSGGDAFRSLLSGGGEKNLGGFLLPPKSRERMRDLLIASYGRLPLPHLTQKTVFSPPPSLTEGPETPSQEKQLLWKKRKGGGDPGNRKEFRIFLLRRRRKVIIVPPTLCV